jgi:outer membrane receptor protein involved in Fe transport
MSLIRYLILGSVLLCGIAAAQRDTPATVALDIEPQPIRAALEQFASQTGLQVVLRDEDLRAEEVVASRVVGRLSVEQALGRLLAGTALQYEFINTRTVRISRQEKVPAPQPAVRIPPAQSPPAAQMRLARADDRLDERDTRADRSAADTAHGVSGIPEILVKGTRSANTDIRRTEDDVQPYVVFDAQDIESSMAENLEDFLRTRLPMNAAAGANAQNTVSGRTFGNQSAIDLRGLGVNQTLILVNGRRMPGVAEAGDFGQPDINGIALSSVARIEVLPSTAGGIYGGGATGGVINIILKTDYRGLELNARYDNTFDTDAARRRLDAIAGFSLENGRTNVMISASVSDANTLSRSDRDLLARARQLQLDNNAAGIYGGATPPMGATANIRSTTGVDLTLQSSGQSIGSAVTHVPYGYAGPQSDGGAALAANAGQYNLDLPRDPHWGGGYLVNPAVTSFTLNARREFTDRLEFFVDASLLENSTSSQVNGLPINTPYILQPSAPNNPFQQPIRVTFGATDLTYGGRTTTESATLRTGAGLMLRLPRDWTVQAQYDWSRSRRDYVSSTSVLTTAARTAMANGTLDILRDVGEYPLDYSPYHFTPMPSYILGPMESRLTGASLRAAGATVDLPGGPVMLSAALERREMALQGNLLTSYTQPDVPVYTYYPPRGQETDSAYVELTAPLISAVNARGWARALDLQASYRRDETTTRAVAAGNSVFRPDSLDEPLPQAQYNYNSVQAHQYTLGLRYQPVEQLAVRFSHGSGILPPSNSQLVPLVFNQNLSDVGDPKRDGAPVGLIENSFSGSIQLVPEQSDSWSGGLIFTPARLPGLRLSVDYTRIEKTDEIATLNIPTLLLLEDSFPGRVQRAELTEADIADEYTGGQIQAIDSGLINIARSEMEAIDTQIDYRWSTAFGAFRASVLATRQMHLTQQVLADSPMTELVGYSGGPLKWRGNAGLTWDRAAWTAGWNMQYYDGYHVYNANAAPVVRDNAVLNQGSDRIPRQMYHDLFLRYRFDGGTAFASGLLANSQIMLGINNVLDTRPPVVATISPSGNGYSGLGDPRLRRYSISLRKDFR